MCVCVCVCVYKLFKQSMEYYFCLDFLYIFLHYIHMGFTSPKRLFISLHFAKSHMKSDEVRAELQLCKRCGGSKSKVAETQFPGS